MRRHPRPGLPMSSFPTRRWPSPISIVRQMFASGSPGGRRRRYGNSHRQRCHSETGSLMLACTQGGNVICNRAKSATSTVTLEAQCMARSFHYGDSQQVVCDEPAHAIIRDGNVFDYFLSNGALISSASSVLPSVC